MHITTDQCRVPDLETGNGNVASVPRNSENILICST
jgi:hypothetical protein